MDMAFKPWLPDEALDGRAVEALLEDAVEQWSAKWFAKDRMRPTDDLFSVAPGHASSADLRFQVLDGELAVASTASGRAAIARAMLGAGNDAGKPGPDGRKLPDRKPLDRKLLDRLSAACIDDFCARLGQTFKLERDARWRTDANGGAMPFDDARECAWGLGDAPLLLLLVAPVLEIALVRSRLPLCARPEKLPPLAAGLAGQNVSLSAFLGRCDLTVAELSGLASGDVLVLDRDLGTPLDLAVDGRVKPGRCTVGHDRDRLSLSIVEPLAG